MSPKTTKLQPKFVAATPGEVTGSLSDLVYMQELTKSICKATPEHITKQLIDQRDGKSYWVTKLRDSNCWMTQNLDYDDPNSARIVDVSKWTSTNASYRAYYDNGDTQTGNYYSYQAAVNGTAPSGAGEASGNICPNANWQLPTSDSTTVNGSFGKLTTTYGATASTISAAPLNFVAGGRADSGKLNNAGTVGYYWSSTANGVTYAYLLNFTSSTVNPSLSNARYYGAFVRCLVLGS